MVSNATDCESLRDKLFMLRANVAKILQKAMRKYHQQPPAPLEVPEHAEQALPLVPVLVGRAHQVRTLNGVADK